MPRRCPTQARGRFTWNSRTDSARYLLGAGLAVALGFALADGNPALAQTWTELSPTGGPPPGRHHHSAVYDPTTNQMIVFGGRTSLPVPFGHVNDLWSLSDANGIGSPVWMQLAPAGTAPSPRFVHRVSYDEANDRMIVFGGGLGVSSPCTNDVRVLVDASGAGGTPTWTPLFPTGPGGFPGLRFAHSVVYNPNSNKLIVFGGSDCFSAPTFGDLWVLSNANGSGGPPTWALLGQSGSAPGLLSGHTAVYDSVNNRMIVFGGLAINNNVWVLENADGTGGPPTWSLLSPSGTPPPARSNHQAVYDAAANEMIVFGGETPGFVNDVWVLSGANGLGGTPTWAELFPSGGPPLARTATTAVFDQATKRMTVFGGSGSNLNDVWVLSLEDGAAEADLSITKTDDPDPVVAGQTLTYTVTVANGGPDDAENVVVGDTLPSGVTFVGTSGCDNDANGVPTCQLGTIANGASKSYTITVTVDATTAAGTITNAATVTSDADDPVPRNNDVTVETVVIELVNIDIHPGSFPNSINSCSKGAIPIAILGSASLDVTDIDPDTLAFAGAGIKMVGKTGRLLCSVEDVSGPPPGPGGADDPSGVPDGFSDLVCHFVTVDLAAISPGDTSASVQGAFLSGGAFVGTDSINIVKDACL